jgi:hypothetical protein
LWFSDVVCVICCVVGGEALAVAVWHLGGARELISLCNYVSTTNATLLVNSLTAVLISHGQPQMQGSANLASTLLLVASSLIPLSVAHVSLHSKPDHSSGEQLIKRRDTYTLPHNEHCTVSYTSRHQSHPKNTYHRTHQPNNIGGTCRFASSHMYKCLSHSRSRHAVSQKRRNTTSDPRCFVAFYADPSRPAAAFCAASCSLICLDQYLEGANLSGCFKKCQLHSSLPAFLHNSSNPHSANVPRASCICAPSPR